MTIVPKIDHLIDINTENGLWQPKEKTLSLCIVILAFLLSSMTHLSDPNETAMRNLPYSLLLKHI